MFGWCLPWGSDVETCRPGWRKIFLCNVDVDAEIQMEGKKAGVQIILAKIEVAWQFFYFYLETRENS